MKKINNYLFKLTIKYILINQLIILFLVIFLNLIELTRVLDNDNKNLFSFFYLSLLKVPSTINETSPFIIIISTAFLFKYLITNNEFISMRNIGFSIFDIFQPISISILVYGFSILFFLNPLTSFTEIEYDKFLNNKNDNTYSINFSENSLWIKNKSNNDGIHYINIENFDIKSMLAENIKILSIDKSGNEFLQSYSGKIIDKKFILNDVDFFNLSNDKYEYIKKLNLELNFSKENILSSVINYKNIPYYNYLDHIKTLKKFNLYSSAIGLHYLSEILKPFFMIILSFVVMGFSAKYKRNESFFRVLFIAVLLGFIFYILREVINKFTLTFDVNFIYSYLIIFITPFIIGLYKVVQIEND
tara:strand:+ start:5237 stop:6316 length:1080 start_codon:yes stop_codon:yes gene_type:complete